MASYKYGSVFKTLYSFGDSQHRKINVYGNNEATGKNTIIEINYLRCMTMLAQEKTDINQT